MLPDFIISPVKFGTFINNIWPYEKEGFTRRICWKSQSLEMWWVFVFVFVYDNFGDVSIAEVTEWLCLIYTFLNLISWLKRNVAQSQMIINLISIDKLYHSTRYVWYEDEKEADKYRSARVSCFCSMLVIFLRIHPHSDCLFI